MLYAVTSNRFYAILFDHNPELRPLFANDINLQTRMPTSMLSSLVKGLNRTPEISGGLRALGRRHEGYQATPADYGKVANALLVTLEEFLGDDFTADVRDAWVTVFGKISGLMIRGWKDDAQQRTTSAFRPQHRPTGIQSRNGNTLLRVPIARSSGNLGLPGSNLARRLVSPAMKRSPEVRSVAKPQREGDVFIGEIGVSEIFERQLRSQFVKQSAK